MTAAVGDRAHARAVRETRQALDTIDDTSLVSMTRLGLDEVRALKQEVAEIFPASNLPAFLLQGLLQLEDRTLRQDKVAADLRVLFRGSAQLGLYGAFLVAPATVLYGYQKLLSLAGKDVDSAFPDGIWQFYTEFGLREDAAHHTIETVGFGLAFPNASAIDSATSWLYAAMQTLHRYDDLVANEWEEKMLPRQLDLVLADRAAAQPGRRLPRRANEREQAIATATAELARRYRVDTFRLNWALQRPYHLPDNANEHDFADYRRARFRAYAEQALRHLPPDLREEVESRFASRRAEDLPRYRRQIALSMTLQPETHREHRVLLPLHMVSVALLVGGRYHLIDACARDDQGTLLVFADASSPDSGTPLALSRTDSGEFCDRYGNIVEIDQGGRVRVAGRALGRLRPPTIATVKSQVAAIFRQLAEQTEPASDLDLLLVSTPRTNQSELRGQLSDATRRELIALQYAPIVINWDTQAVDRPLPEIRQARRGCGDHTMTLLRAGHAMVFDLSHIFCDALWGIALAEIATGYAISAYPAVRAARASRVQPAAPLQLSTTAAFRTAALNAAAHIPRESSAQSSAVDLAAMNRLRKRLATVDLKLTVTDLLLLGRFVHAAAYRPGVLAEAALETVTELPDGPALARQISRSIEEHRLLNPSLLIPMDATNADPRLRLYPATFRNPLSELLVRLERCDTLARSLRRGSEPGALRTFERERKELYRDLSIFADVLLTLKLVTTRGESFSTAALRLMGHLPSALQNIVDMIPQKVGILNEILKGHEVYSNAGHVAPTSSITRFSSARDDGDTKLLIWGVVTDANGRLVITLRDFRPHVAPLVQHGRQDLARVMTQDYLNAYVTCVNDLVARIQRVLSYK